MDKIKRFAQDDSNPHAFFYRQSSAPELGAFADQITRLVKGGVVLPVRFQRIAEFHHIIEAAVFLCAEKIHPQQAGMRVRNGFILLNPVKFTLIWIGIIVKFCEVNDFQCTPFSSGVPCQPDFAICAFGKCRVKQFVAGSVWHSFCSGRFCWIRHTTNFSGYRPGQSAGHLPTGNNQPGKPVDAVKTQQDG